MTKIKIISNPYENSILYQRYDSENQWIPVHDNSRLLSQKNTSGVFPFRVYEIVNIIIEEFQSDSEKIEILFEGTDDEYQELFSVCRNAKFSVEVTVSKSENCLRNARDILPEIKNVFQRMQPLVINDFRDNQEIRTETEKFQDVSKETIPICIMGNYSSGKSTFINALIGYEILPSGDESLTAKIHRISRSRFRDKAKIQFFYDNQEVVIQFTDGIEHPWTSFATETPLFKAIDNEIQKTADFPVTARVNHILGVLNLSEKFPDGQKLSDLITVEIPFNENSLFGKSRHHFIIFDTPGSNAASNRNHFAILKQAMKKLSNGLPIYISEYDKLDSTDNEHLCQELNSIQELDNRFTMIVVNKADRANLNHLHIGQIQETLLNQTIPKLLYTGGIYFVSSVMGLGAKSRAENLSDHYAETFYDGKEKYSNPNSRFYKQLYLYNLLPAQRKPVCNQESEICPNRILANSGLFWIEYEIETFAERYSAYNKCQQLKLFLDKVVSVTKSEISAKFQICEEKKQEMESNLEKEKAELLNKITSRKETLQADFSEKCISVMTQRAQELYQPLTESFLTEQETEISSNKKNASSYQNQSEQKSQKLQQAQESFKNMIGSKNLNALKSGLKESADNLRSSLSISGEIRETQREIEKQTADALLELVKNRFNEYVLFMQEKLKQSSEEYWTACAETLKSELVGIVTGSSALTAENKQELSSIIMTYQNISFNAKADSIFVKKEFEQRSLELFGFTLFENNKLNKRKLVKRYNSEIQSDSNIIVEQIKKAHETTFIAWAKTLLSTIRDNLTKYNRELRKLTLYIQDEEERIAELEKRLSLLDYYSEEVRQMLDWKKYDES